MSLLSELGRLVSTEIPELEEGPHSQLLEYGSNFRKFETHFQPSVRAYLETTMAPNFGGLRDYIFSSDIHRWWLLDLISWTREDTIANALVLAATSYDSQRGSTYSARIRDAIGESSLENRYVSYSGRYRRLRERLLEETTVGRLVRGGLYKDAHDLMVAVDHPNYHGEIYPLLVEVPPEDYHHLSTQLLDNVGEVVDDSRVVAATAREEVRTWLVGRLGLQFPTTPPTGEERRDYWRTGDNLPALVDVATGLFTVMEESALTRLYDYIVRDYERSNHYYQVSGYESRDPDLALMHTAQPRLLAALRGVPEISELLRTGNYREVPRLDRLGSEAPGYSEVVEIVRDIYPISRDEIVEFAFSSVITTLINRGDDSGVDEILSGLSGRSATLEFHSWLRQKLVGAVEGGSITDDDETVESYITSLEESGEMNDAEEGLVTAIEDELTREIVGLCITRYYIPNAEPLGLELERLGEVEGDTPESGLYRTLMGRLYPVIYETPIGELLADDLYVEVSEEFYETEPSERMWKSIYQIVESPVTELALLDLVGTNLGSYLETTGVLDHILRPPGDQRRPVLVADLKYLLSPEDNEREDSPMVWLPDGEALFYRSTTLGVLKGALELGYQLVLYNAPLVGYRDLLQRLRELLPGVSLCRVPPLVDESGEWSATRSLERLVSERIRPNGSSIIVRGGEWSVGQPPISNRKIKRIALTNDILWFTRLELFPARPHLGRSLLRPNVVNVLLLAGNSIPEVDDAIVGGLGTRPTPVVFPGTPDEVPRDLVVGSVAICTLHSYDYNTEVDFDVLARKIRTLRGAYAATGSPLLNVRMVWYYVDRCDYQHSSYVEDPLEVTYTGDIQRLLDVLSGPPVRLEN